MIKVVALLLLSFGAVAFAAPEGRVVNGTDGDVQDYPFIISIRNVRGGHSCAGSIIAPNWILTAAHCVYNRDIFNFTIQYGVTTVNTKGPNIAYVKRFIYHEKYDPEYITDDVALLELHGNLVFNGKTIGLVKLPTQNFETLQTSQGDVGVLAGWGRNYTGSPIVPHLQEVTLKVYSDQECASRFSEVEDTVITSNNICGGVDEGWKGQCNGDSGGPLILKNSGVQVGIVSWSIKPCATPPYPGVYTKVSHYIDWIERNMIST